MIRRPILLFTSSIPDPASLVWPEGAIAVWYDGESQLVEGLAGMAVPTKLVVEKPLLQSAAIAAFADAASDVEVWESHNAPPESGSSSPWLLLPSNDTHVSMLAGLLSDGPENLVRVLNSKREGARAALAALGVEGQEIRGSDIAGTRGLIVANDWGAEEKYWVHRFRLAGKPTFCLQESVINFRGEARRMRWTAFPLLQGFASVEPLGRQLVFLTGNPRYEQLRPTDLPPVKRVLVNSNFTYGVLEDVRQRWLNDVVGACRRRGYPYLIAQHPRDDADLLGFNTLRTSSASIHETIVDHSLLVTRFSSLIHEALALGRPVIYYNPHRESMYYDFEPDGEHLRVVEDPVDLEAAIEELIGLASNPRKDPFYEAYAWRHVGSFDGRASSRVMQAMEVAARLPKGVTYPLRINSVNVALGKEKAWLASLKRRIATKWLG